jgi:signal transduction histidine kinase
MSDSPSGDGSDAQVRAERQRLAQGLHDTVCQTLSGAYLRAALVVRKQKAGQKLELEEIEGVRDTLQQAVGELHQLVTSLRLEGDGR